MSDSLKETGFPSQLEVNYAELYEGLVWKLGWTKAEHVMLKILQHEGNSIYTSMSIVKLAKKMNGL